MLDPRSSLVVFAAHADDETLGAGGTVAALSRAGSHVEVAVATDSASAQYDGDEAVQRRRAEFADAMEVLGVARTHWLGKPDMRLAASDALELNAWCQQVVQEAGAGAVLTPFSGDINEDHRALTQAVHVATRPRPGTCADAVLEYETVSATEWGSLSAAKPFEPDVFFDISETLAIKEEALRCYASELREGDHPRTVENVRNLARLRGVSVGRAFAEAFSLVYLRM